MKKTYIFVFLVFLVTINIFSQNQILPSKIIYQNKEGNIFVNRAIPLFIKISADTSNNTEHFLLNYKSNDNNTIPIYLGNEGLNIFYSPWAIDPITKKYAEPKRNVNFELYGDSKAPVTKILNNETAYSKSDSLFFSSELKVWLTASDNVSGIDKTYISINGEDYSEYLQDTISFEQGQYYTIKYYSTDKVGNYENVKDVSFMIDTTKPLTNLVVFGKHIDNITSAEGKVSLKPLDAFSGTAKTYYFIDNSPQTIYTEPVAIGNLREGRHVLCYFSQDNVKNNEVEKSYEFYIDKTPPIVMSEVVGDYIFVNGKAYTSGRSQIQLTAIDNKADVKSIYYSFDAKKWVLYTEPFYLPNDQKTINVYYYAEDNVGNIGKKDLATTQGSDKIFLSELDLIPPSLSYSFSGPNVRIFDTTYISATTQINLKAADSQAGIRDLTYSINDSENKTYTNSFSINNQGFQRIMLIAMDQVNNMSTQDFFVKVDTTGPKISIDFSSKSYNIDNNLVYPVGTLVNIFAKDENSNVFKIYFKINNSTYTEYFKYLTINQSGDYELEVKAEDVLGNFTVEKFSFKIR